jgi:hypothetical protein
MMSQGRTCRALLMSGSLRELTEPKRRALLA